MSTKKYILKRRTVSWKLKTRLGVTLVIKVSSAVSLSRLLLKNCASFFFSSDQYDRSNTGQNAVILGITGNFPLLLASNNLPYIGCITDSVWPIVILLYVSQAITHYFIPELIMYIIVKNYVMEFLVISLIWLLFLIQQFEIHKKKSCFPITYSKMRFFAVMSKTNREWCFFDLRFRFSDSKYIEIHVKIIFSLMNQWKSKSLIQSVKIWLIQI